MPVRVYNCIVIFLHFYLYAPKSNFMLRLWLVQKSLPRFQAGKLTQKGGQPMQNTLQNIFCLSSRLLIGNLALLSMNNTFNRSSLFRHVCDITLSFLQMYVCMSPPLN